MSELLPRRIPPTLPIPTQEYIDILADAERFRVLEKAFTDRQWFFENADNVKTLAEMADKFRDA